MLKPLLLLLTLIGSGIPFLPTETPAHQARGATRHDVADARYVALGLAPQFASVGLLRLGDEPRASAILVTPQWVLTAGHAAEDAERGLIIELGVRAYEVVEVVVHQDYRPRQIGNGTDLALMKLAEPVVEVLPAVRYRGYAERGAVATAVGFGVAGAGINAVMSPAPSGTKRAGTNVIDATGGRIDGRRIPDNLLVADFDRPGDPSLNRTGRATPLELEYMPLGGDSGGGLFIEQNGSWMLAGVFSGYTFSVGTALEIGMYGSLMYWTRLSLYNEWVDEVTGSAALFRASELWALEAAAAMR
jgi:hypothetical protein